MNLAAWRFPVSIRHDVIVPALVVLGLWCVAAWYYAMNTDAVGTIVFPAQAMARAMQASCVSPELARQGGWRIKLHAHRWLVYNEFKGHFWERPYGFAEVMLDAHTGKVIDCRVSFKDW